MKKRINKRLYHLIELNLNQGNSLSKITRYLNKTRDFKITYKSLCNMVCRSDLRHLAIAKKAYEHFRPSVLDNMHMYKTEDGNDYIFTFKPKRETITQKTNYKEEIVHDIKGSNIIMTGTNDIQIDGLAPEDYKKALFTGDSITDFALIGDNPPKHPLPRADGNPSRKVVYQFKDLQNKEINIKLKDGELTLEITW